MQWIQTLKKNKITLSIKIHEIWAKTLEFVYSFEIS